MNDFTPVPALLGGAMIGLAAALFWLSNGRIAGVSGMLGGALKREDDSRAVRLSFVLGLIAGGLLLRLVYPAAFVSAWLPSWPLAAVAGVLVGFGTQLGNGCTSGHGICGIGRFSARSMVATAVFMASGILTVFVSRHLLGGGAS